MDQIFGFSDGRLRTESAADGGNNNDICQMMLRYNQVDNNEYLYDEDDDCDDDDYDVKKLPQQDLLRHTRRGRPPGLHKTAAQQGNCSTPGFSGGTTASGGSAGSGDEMCCGAGKTADRISRYISKRDEVGNAVENSAVYERRGK